MRWFLEVVYQLELNNFTVKKCRLLKFKDESIAKLEYEFYTLMTHHRLYKTYLDCMESFEKFSQSISSMASNKKYNPRTSLMANKKMAIIPSFQRENVDINNFLTMKNILKKTYELSRTFKVEVHLSTFRVIVLAFMYLYDTIDVSSIRPLENAMGNENSKAMLLVQ